MKIQCSKCKTVYDISDDRIPKQGIDTKCKKCGNAIHIEKNDSGTGDLLKETMLSECKECGKDVSKEAKICPHCGAKLKQSLFGKVKEQAGELGEKAKEQVSGLGEMTKEVAKKVDKEQLYEIAEKTKKITSEHSGKLDRFLWFSFKFGKIISALFVFVFRISLQVLV